MIKHIVMWKLVDEHDGLKKDEIKAKLTELFLALPSKIPAINTLETGGNCNDNELEADFVLITTHDSMEKLKEYAIHEEHIKVGKYIANVKLSRVCVDYEF